MLPFITCTTHTQRAKAPYIHSDGTFAQTLQRVLNFQKLSTKSGHDRKILPLKQCAISCVCVCPLGKQQQRIHTTTNPSLVKLPYNIISETLHTIFKGWAAYTGQKDRLVSQDSTLLYVMCSYAMPICIHYFTLPKTYTRAHMWPGFVYAHTLGGGEHRIWSPPHPKYATGDMRTRSLYAPGYILCIHTHTHIAEVAIVLCDTLTITKLKR